MAERLYKESIVRLTVSATTAPAIRTNVTFWSYDINTARQVFEITKNNDSINLTNASEVTLVLQFAGLPNTIHLIPEIEDAENGIISIILPTQALGYDGEVTGGLFIKFNNSQSFDCGYFIFSLRTSSIDEDVGDLADFYVQRFEDLKDEINKLAEDIQRRLNLLELDKVDVGDVVGLDAILATKATIAKAQMHKLSQDDGLSFQLKVGDDLNNFKKLGFYACQKSATAQTLLNSPTAGAFSMRVWDTTADNGCSQELIEYRADVYSRCFERRYYNGTWSGWREVLYKQDNIIRMRDGGGVAKSVITVRDGNSYGIGVSLGAGGATVVGGGESAELVLKDHPQITTGADECMFVANDNDVKVITNLQNGLDVRKEFSFGSDGVLTTPGAIKEAGTSLGDKYSAKSHNHAISDVTNLQPTLDVVQKHKLTQDDATALPYGADMDDLKTPGFYYIGTNATNKPHNIYGFCRVTRLTVGNGWHQDYVTASTAAPMKWVRYHSLGVWSDWHHVNTGKRIQLPNGTDVHTVDPGIYYLSNPANTPASADSSYWCLDITALAPTPSRRSYRLYRQFDHGSEWVGAGNVAVDSEITWRKVQFSETIKIPITPSNYDFPDSTDEGEEATE